MVTGAVAAAVLAGHGLTKHYGPVSALDDVDIDINGVLVNKQYVRRISIGELRGGLKGTRFEVDLEHCPPFQGDNVLGLLLTARGKPLRVPMMEELEVHVTEVADSKAILDVPATRK